jgi:hypothetical protein
MIFRFLLALLSFSSGGAAFSKEDAPRIDCVDSGVWVGQIGDRIVTLGFSQGSGRYYYGANLQDLALQRDVSQSNRWLEFDMNGAQTGTIDLTCGQSMHGTWTSVDESKQFQLKATRVIPDKTETSEESEADDAIIEVESYLNARFLMPPETQKQKAFFDGHEYLMLKVRGLSPAGIELRGNHLRISAINRQLREDFDRNVEGALHCSYWWLALNGPKHGIPFTAQQRITFWRGPNIVVFSETAFCLGDFKETRRNVKIFNTQTGASENGWGPWLEKRHEKGTPESPLIALLTPLYLASHQSQLAQCADFLKSETTISAWPEKTGMALTIDKSHPRMEDGRSGIDCPAILNVPYSTVMPFLSETGKAKLHALLSPK